MTPTERRLREQLLGVRLLAKEATEEVEPARHHLNQNKVGRSSYPAVEEVERALARLDSLLEPLHDAGKGVTS